MWLPALELYIGGETNIKFFWFFEINFVISFFSFYVWAVEGKGWIP